MSLKLKYLLPVFVGVWCAAVSGVIASDSGIDKKRAPAKRVATTVDTPEDAVSPAGDTLPNNRKPTAYDPHPNGILHSGYKRDFDASEVSGILSAETYQMELQELLDQNQPLEES